VGIKLSTNYQIDMKYENDFLTDVIFRVDFPKILDLDIKKPTAEFQKKIFERFPIMDEAIKKKVKYQLGAEEAEINDYNELLWKFSDKEDNKKVFISSVHISIEYSKYENFEELFNDIEQVFRAFIDLYPVAVARRIGLRFVNQIEIKEGNPFDWDNLLDPSLVSVTNGFTSKDDKVLRNMHLLQLKEGDYDFKFQYGMFNSGYPNPISRREFILDYDCSIKNVDDINEIFKIAKESHKIVKKWFEKSIRKGLRDIMGVKDGF